MKIFLLLFSFFLASDQLAHAMTCTNAGQLRYDPNTKGMQLCDGSNFKLIGGGIGQGTGCHWVSWGSSGQAAGGNPALYASPTGGNFNGSAGFCNLSDYAAGVVGTGITTGAKRDFGMVLCCPLGG